MCSYRARIFSSCTTLLCVQVAITLADASVADACAADATQHECTTHFFASDVRGTLRRHQIWAPHDGNRPGMSLLAPLTRVAETGLARLVAALGVSHLCKH